MPNNENVFRKSWPKTTWDKVVTNAEKIVFRLIAGKSAGTCFAISMGTSSTLNSKFVMFATAWHVVKAIAGKNITIYMISANGKTVCEAKPGCYAIFLVGPEEYDTALIMVKNTENIITPKDMMPLFGVDVQIPRGTEIGIVGFPGIAKGEYSFFKGVISSYQNNPSIYLVDAVGINGVSGGPAFDNRAQIVGIVSSYIPNRVNTQTTLPGLVALIPIGLARYWMETKLNARIL